MVLIGSTTPVSLMIHSGIMTLIGPYSLDGSISTAEEFQAVVYTVYTYSLYEPTLILRASKSQDTVGQIHSISLLNTSF